MRKPNKHNYTISLFASVRETTAARVSLSWADLRAALTDPLTVESKEKAPGWSPAVFEGDKRGEPVEAIACLVFDIDEALPTLPVDVAWVAHTTHSHTPAKPRWRVVVATDRPHTPSEHEMLWRGTALAFGLSPDAVTADPGRFYWSPSRPAERAEHWQTRESSSNRPLLVDMTLRVVSENKDLKNVAEKTRVQMPALEAAHPPPTQVSTNGGAQKTPIFSDFPGAPSVDLEKLRLRIKTLRHGKTRTALLSLLDFGALPSQGGRNAWMHSTFSAAGALGLGQAEADWLAQSFASRLELASGETVEEWKRLALYSYQRAAEQRAHRDSLTTTFTKVLGTVPQEDWRHRLITTAKPGSDMVRVESCGHNVSLVLSNDDAFASLRWNLMTLEVEFPQGPFANLPKGTLDVAVTDWLFSTPEYRIRMAREEVAARLVAVARSKPYDPVREYLEGLKWDGVQRLDSFLRVYAGVEYGDGRYARNVSRRFLVGAVARALRPGCQMDNILLLQGAQGAGKTSLVRVLGGPYMAELHMDPSNKDTLQAIAGRWFVELSELASARKTDVESMRAFITRRIDVLRLPYGRVTEEFPRRCVLVGTTNEETPLNDAHGNRRYWPVMVGRVDVHALERDRDQLFAEAVVAFKAGERWWFDGEEQGEANREAELFTDSDAWVEVIREWFYKIPLEQRPKAVSVAAVAVKALRMEPNQLTRSVTVRISFALRALHFVRLGLKGKSGAMYETPKEFLEEVRP